MRVASIAAIVAGSITGANVGPPFAPRPAFGRWLSSIADESCQLPVASLWTGR